MADTYQDYAKMIDHALLHPALTGEDLEAGCRLALAYDVASVCIMPYYLARCAQLLRESTVKPSTVIGFPHGANRVRIKLAEARQALEDGGQELDIVINISRAVSGDWDYVAEEIRALTDLTHAAGQKIKIIFENAYLNEEQKIRLCEISTQAGADWVKTSTGFAATGATLDDLALMLRHSGPGVQVKAAGGVRDSAMLRQIHAMGVTRCGTSKTDLLLEGIRQEMGLAPVTTAGSHPPGAY